MNSDNELKEQSVFKETGEKESHQSESKTNKTSSGLEQNIAGLLCYLFWFITGIIFLVIEKENQFVRFHAMQSIFLGVAIIIVSFILTIIPFIGWLISLLLFPLTLILWVFMMFKAYKGELFKFPVIGDIAEQQIDKVAN